MLETIITLKSIEKSPDGDVAFLTFVLEEKMKYKAGQFVMLESINYLFEWKWIRRAYSIATTPKHLTKTNEIWFLVKKASEKWLSHYLTQLIQVGDQVKLIGPAWHFTDSETGIYSKYLFMSIGSGVAALHPQYLELTQEWKPFDKLVNMFGERYQHMLLPHIEELFSEQSKKVKNILYLSREKNLPQWYHHGYIQESLEEALVFLEDTNFMAFLCGKPAMVEAAVKILLKRWLSKEQIKFEKY